MIKKLLLGLFWLTMLVLVALAVLYYFYLLLITFLFFRGVFWGMAAVGILLLIIIWRKW